MKWNLYPMQAARKTRFFCHLLLTLTLLALECRKIELFLFLFSTQKKVTGFCLGEHDMLCLHSLLSLSFLKDNHLQQVDKSDLQDRDEADRLRWSAVMTLAVSRERCKAKQRHFAVPRKRWFKLRWPFWGESVDVTDTLICYNSNIWCTTDTKKALCPHATYVPSKLEYTDQMQYHQKAWGHCWQS